MNKKILLQLFLFVFFLSVVWLVFKSYNTRDIFSEDININNEISSNKIEKKEEIKKTVTKNESFENTISSLSYSTTDEEGNKYSIFATEGKIDEITPHIINMLGVEAKIEIINQETIYIYSNNAVFDNINFNSKFTNDVKLLYLDHSLKGGELDLDLDKKLITLSNKVIYKNSNTELNADYMTLDLINKTSEIAMYDKSKKVKIFQIN